MEYRTITEFGKVSKMVYSVKGLTEAEKKELIDAIGSYVMNSMDEAVRVAKCNILKTYK